jgi:hypothetical protein
LARCCPRRNALPLTNLVVVSPEAEKIATQ